LIEFSDQGGMQTEDPALLMKWYQFIYFQNGITSKDFRKEKIGDIVNNIAMQEAMMRKNKRMQDIEEMKRKALQ